MDKISLEASIKDRTKGIGGSDVHHLFNLKPYGCSRLLWYEKMGIEADFPFLGNNATERGNRLEDIAAEEYTKKTERRIQKSFKCYTYSDWGRGHIDRLILKDKRGSGVLEIKVPGEHMFRKIKREGLPESYILQLQYYLLLTGCNWGSYCIFWADGWELLSFDMERNIQLIDVIMAKAVSFWNSVKNQTTPDRLDSTDSRCGKCSYRTTCQGRLILETIQDDSEELEYDESFSSLIAEYAEARDIYSESEEYLNGIKEKIRDLMGDKPAIRTDGGKIYYRPTKTMRFNTKLFSKEHPKMAKEYKKESISRTLKIYPRKG